MPFIAMNGIRRFLARMRGARDLPAMIEPLAAAAAIAGTRSRKPHGMARLTAMMASWVPNNSTTAVDVQKTAMRQKPSAAAETWKRFRATDCRGERRRVGS